MRQTDEFFAVAGHIFFRCHNSVCDDIIQKISPCASQKAKITDLNRRGSKCGDGQPAVLSMSHQVNKNVCLIFVNSLCRVNIIQMSQVNEFVAILCDSLSVITAVILSAGIAKDFKFIAVVEAV